MCTHIKKLLLSSNDSGIVPRRRDDEICLMKALLSIQVLALLLSTYKEFKDANEPIELGKDPSMFFSLIFLIIQN